jgi:hypothetical protein
LGPSPGGLQDTPSPSIKLNSTFISPNRFESLRHLPEYRALIYIDIDYKSPESDEWISTRVLLDSGGQDSFINDKLSTSYQLPRLIKPQSISLILADGRPSKGGSIHHYNTLTLRIAEYEEAIGLDIAPTIHHIILGMPWLEKYDPIIHYG